MVEIRALFFDVFGTVVDWRCGIAREAEVLLAPLGYDLDWFAFADAWRAEYQPGMEEVRAGRIPVSRLLPHRVRRKARPKSRRPPSRRSGGSSRRSCSRSSRCSLPRPPRPSGCCLETATRRPSSRATLRSTWARQRPLCPTAPSSSRPPSGARCRPTSSPL